MSKRDNYYSFLKGLAIIAVLFIHTDFEGSLSAGIAVRQMMTFAVALFFFLSGFFVKDDKLDTKGITRLMIPYAIWSLLWFAETSITGSQPITIWKIVNTIFFGGAFFPLYFLIVLVELKLISPWIVKRIRGFSKNGDYKWYKDWAWLITPFTLLVLYFIQYITKEQPKIYAQIFPSWFIMYYAGCIVRHTSIKIDKVRALCFTLLGLYLMFVESTIINEYLQVPFWAATQLKFTSFFYSLSLCFLLISLHQDTKRNMIVRLGEMSFGIFIIHLPIKKVLESVINTYVGHFWGFQLLSVCLALFVCWVFLSICYRFLPIKVNRWLGFA